jgi:mono/diheme cytochrome c family protein
MPRWLVPAFVLLVVTSFIPAAMIARARATKQSYPRINIIPDMDNQPKFLPQTENDLFADHRAMRSVPPGTVARGQLRADDAFYRGRAGGDWVTTIPVRAAQEAGSWEALVTRGQERFGIYCAVCHGAAGYGDGMVAQRAALLAEQGLANWTPPSSLHDEVVRTRPDGHLFNTITNGIRTMPAYGTQIHPVDRWAIVAYVRALERSQRATLADVPAAKRLELEGRE